LGRIEGITDTNLSSKLILLQGRVGWTGLYDTCLSKEVSLAQATGILGFIVFVTSTNLVTIRIHRGSGIEWTGFQTYSIEGISCTDTNIVGQDIIGCTNTNILPIYILNRNSVRGTGGEKPTNSVAI